MFTTTKDLSKYIKISKELVRRFYKDDEGKVFEMSDGQGAIFSVIYFKEIIQHWGYNRVQVIAPTQYGKSSTIAMALNLRSQGFKEDWGIITGQQKKSDIIMSKLIQHLFDDKRLYTQLDLDKNEPLERIKRERSKQKVNWRGKGGVETFTAIAGNKKRVKDALSGLGIANAVEDEASLIVDVIQSMIMRMFGGHKGGYLVKVGNPYTRGHFLRSWQNDKYFKIFIDKDQALKEGRYTEEFIQEMKNEAFFDILYECKFPPEDEIDIDGYRRLLSDTDIDNAQKEIKHEGEIRLGFDIGEGGDENSGVVRSNKYAEIVHSSKIKDLMATAGVIVRLLKELAIKDELCFADKNGVGAGVVARLKELGREVVGVNWAEKSESNTFSNSKAEQYWKLRAWIKEGGKLKPDNGWNELREIKYKEDSAGKLKIKSKEEMRKDGIKSPNNADALAMTFCKSLEDNAPRILIM
jgi:hypothetical protein